MAREPRRRCGGRPDRLLVPICRSPQFAQFERELTIERTRAGLAAARAAGKPIGRKSPIHPDQAAHMRQLSAEGKSYRDIARLTGQSKAAVDRVLRGEIPTLAVPHT